MRWLLALLIAAPAWAQSPFPVDITAKFDLIDQTGTPRTEADFAGKHMLIFFGYANCESICTVALPALGETLDLLGDDLALVQPLMITIDPQADTAEALATKMPDYHPAFLGLTGTDDALAAARMHFQVEIEEIFRTPDDKPVYAHGSFVYLTDETGKVLTLLPPILSPEWMAKVIRTYL